MKSKVYFTKEITKEAILKMYQVLEKELTGNVAVKVHSGEAGNQNYLRPEMYENVIKHLNGTVVECNTAYDGERNTTEKHKRLLDTHDWTKYYKVDLLDESEEIALEIPNGKIIKNEPLDIYTEKDGLTERMAGARFESKENLTVIHAETFGLSSNTGVSYTNYYLEIAHRVSPFTLFYRSPLSVKENSVRQNGIGYQMHFVNTEIAWCAPDSTEE